MKRKGKAVMVIFFRIVLVLSLSSILAILTACGGVSNVKWIPNQEPNPVFEPYQGAVRVMWRRHGEPEGLKGKKYYPLGKISGRSLFCGTTPPIRNEELQNHLIEQARQHGGNAIILECGYGGYDESQCYCYGDVLRYIE